MIKVKTPKGFSTVSGRSDTAYNVDINGSLDALTARETCWFAILKHREDNTSLPEPSEDEFYMPSGYRKFDEFSKQPDHHLKWFDDNALPIIRHSLDEYEIRKSLIEPFHDVPFEHDVCHLGFAIAEANILALCKRIKEDIEPDLMVLRRAAGHDDSFEPQTFTPEDEAFLKETLSNLSVTSSYLTTYFGEKKKEELLLDKEYQQWAKDLDHEKQADKREQLRIIYNEIELLNAVDRFKYNESRRLALWIEVLVFFGTRNISLYKKMIDVIVPCLKYAEPYADSYHSFAHEIIDFMTRIPTLPSYEADHYFTGVKEENADNAYYAISSAEELRSYFASFEETHKKPFQFKEIPDEEFVKFLNHYGGYAKMLEKNANDGGSLFYLSDDLCFRQNGEGTGKYPYIYLRPMNYLKYELDTDPIISPDGTLLPFKGFDSHLVENETDPNTPTTTRVHKRIHDHEDEGIFLTPLSADYQKDYAYLTHYKAGICKGKIALHGFNIRLNNPHVYVTVTFSTMYSLLAAVRLSCFINAYFKRDDEAAADVLIFFYLFAAVVQLLKEDERVPFWYMVNDLDDNLCKTAINHITEEKHLHDNTDFMLGRVYSNDTTFTISHQQFLAEHKRIMKKHGISSIAGGHYLYVDIVNDFLDESEACFASKVAYGTEEQVEGFLLHELTKPLYKDIWNDALSNCFALRDDVEKFDMFKASDSKVSIDWVVIRTLDASPLNLFYEKNATEVAYKFKDIASHLEDVDCAIKTTEVYQKMKLFEYANEPVAELMHQPTEDDELLAFLIYYAFVKRIMEWAVPDENKTSKYERSVEFYNECMKEKKLNRLHSRYGKNLIKPISNDELYPTWQTDIVKCMSAMYDCLTKNHICDMHFVLLCRSIIDRYADAKRYSNLQLDITKLAMDVANGYLGIYPIFKLHTKSKADEKLVPHTHAKTMQLLQTLTRVDHIGRRRIFKHDLMVSKAHEIYSEILLLDPMGSFATAVVKTTSNATLTSPIPFSAQDRIMVMDFECPSQDEHIQYDPNFDYRHGWPENIETDDVIDMQNAETIPKGAQRCTNKIYSTRYRVIADYDGFSMDGTHTKILPSNLITTRKIINAFNMLAGIRVYCMIHEFFRHENTEFHKEVLALVYIKMASTMRPEDGYILSNLVSHFSHEMVEDAAKRITSSKFAYYRRKLLKVSSKYSFAIDDVVNILEKGITFKDTKTIFVVNAIEYTANKTIEPYKDIFSDAIPLFKHDTQPIIALSPCEHHPWRKGAYAKSLVPTLEPNASFATALKMSKLRVAMAIGLAMIHNVFPNMNTDEYKALGEKMVLEINGRLPDAFDYFVGNHAKDISPRDSSGGSWNLGEHTRNLKSLDYSLCIAVANLEKAYKYLVEDTEYNVAQCERMVIKELITRANNWRIQLKCGFRFDPNVSYKYTTSLCLVEHSGNYYTLDDYRLAKWLLADHRNDSGEQAATSFLELIQSGIFATVPYHFVGKMKFPYKKTIPTTLVDISQVMEKEGLTKEGLRELQMLTLEDSYRLLRAENDTYANVVRLSEVEKENLSETDPELYEHGIRYGSRFTELFPNEKQMEEDDGNSDGSKKRERDAEEFDDSDGSDDSDSTLPPPPEQMEVVKEKEQVEKSPKKARMEAEKEEEEEEETNEDERSFTPP